MSAAARRAVRAAIALGVAVALSACALAPAPPPAPSAPLVWPDELDVPPRIEYVRAFSSPEEFGIPRGFLRRLVDFLTGADESRLVRPMAVLAAGGVVYVADPGAKGVHRFDPKSAQYDLIGAGDDAPLPSPVALARGVDGDVYVSDSALAKVLVIHRGAKNAAPLPLPKLAQPTGLAFDSATGHLYVVDTGAHRVEVFDRDGTPLSSFGRRGTGDGEFNYPTQIWQDGRGRLFVTDSLNFRIQVFDRDGKFLSKFGQAGDGAGNFMRQKGVATDRYGHVYIVDALQGALKVFDDAGRLLLSLGETGSGRGEFWLPAGVFIDAADMIYVADSYNRRIQVLRYIGGPD